ncbi:MAG: DUF1559 domain-containing protein [Planctomycetales bacterium]
MATRNGWWRKAIAGVMLAACAAAPLGCGGSGDDATKGGAAATAGNDSAANDPAANKAAANKAATNKAAAPVTAASGTQSDPAAAVRKHNIRQFAIAVHNYHDAYKEFPQPAPKPVKEHAGKTSCRVYLCQFLGEEALYREYRFEEPWDSEHNKQFLTRMPAVFADPSRPDATDGKTRIVVVTGPDTVFEDLLREGESFRFGFGIRFRSIFDGMHDTIMAIVVPEEKAVPWTKPEEFVLDPMDPFKGLGGKLPAEGLLVVMCDHSVHLLPPDTTPEMFAALCTRTGGEPVRVGEDGRPELFQPAPAAPPKDRDEVAPPDFDAPKDKRAAPE